MARRFRFPAAFLALALAGAGLAVDQPPGEVKLVRSGDACANPADPPTPAVPLQPASGVQAPETPEPARTKVYQLRHVAAADAAHAVKKFLDGKKMPARFAVDAAANTVAVQTDASAQEEVLRLLAGLDTAPQQVQIQAMVAVVPAGFLEDVGLTDDAPNTPMLTLTPREVNVLVAQIRKAKERQCIDILSRPQILVADGQTGKVQFGGTSAVLTGVEINAALDGPRVREKTTQVEHGLKLAVTPRQTPQGSTDLRAEVTWSAVAPTGTTSLTLPPEVTGLKETTTYEIASPVVNTQTVNMTARLADGGTVVLRGLRCDEPRTHPDDGPFTALVKKAIGPDRRELIIVLTTHRVASVLPTAGQGGR